MQTPMILPWLARKWRISDARAQELWQMACRTAQTEVANDHSSEYIACAKSLLFDLLDQEALSACAPAAMPWVMMRLTCLRFIAAARLWGWPQARFRVQY